MSFSVRISHVSDRLSPFNSYSKSFSCNFSLIFFIISFEDVQFLGGDSLDLIKQLYVNSRTRWSLLPSPGLYCSMFTIFSSFVKIRSKIDGTFWDLYLVGSLTC